MEEAGVTRSRIWAHLTMLGAVVAVMVGCSGSDSDGSSDGRNVDVSEPAGSSPSSTVAGVADSVAMVEIGPSRGVGLVFGAGGEIVTALRGSTAQSGDEATVTFSDGASASAEVLGNDQRSGLVILRTVDGPTRDSVVIADSAGVREGEPAELVIVSGSINEPIPVVVSGASVMLDLATIDVESAEPVNDTDAPVSGGVLFTTDGELLGLVIALSGGEGAQVSSALPSNLVGRVVEQLAAGDQVAHPFFGASLSDAGTAGAQLDQVIPGSPADVAGLETSDVIVRTGEGDVADAAGLVAAIQGQPAGTEMSVEYVRDGTPLSTTVLLTELPDGP